MVKGHGSVFLFCGEDSFLKDDARRKLISEIQPSSASGLDIDKYDAKDESADIFSALNTLPLLSQKRVVVVKDIDRLPEHRREPLLKYIKSPSRHTLLILDGSKRASESKFIKSISSYAKTYDLKKRSPYEMKRWAQDAFNAGKRPISPPALELFMELKGSQDLSAISNEIEKLITYKGGAGRIEEADVLNNIGKSASRTAFNLVDAVSFKKRDTALSIARELMGGSGRAVQEMLGLMGWQFRRLWKARRLKAKGYSNQDICSELRIRHFAVNKFTSQMARFDDKELKRCFALLVKADRGIKNGRNKPENILEELVLKLCD
jgi:DNA polymerase-3 subunit delta